VGDSNKRSKCVERPSVGREEPGGDQRHAGEVARFEHLAQKSRAQDHRAHGNQQRGQQQVGGARGLEDAEIEQAAERGAYPGQRDQR
jgi:hypothetical protein